MILLKIQNFIEQKRLVFGDFLLKNFHSKSQKFSNFTAQKWSQFINWRFFLSFSCALMILLSIFIRSTRDMGQDSIVYIEMAQKILAGGRYYHDFFENNFPLAIYLAIIPVYGAQILDISPIISLDFFINLVGILSIFSCYKIMKYCHLKSQNTKVSYVNSADLSLDLKIILICFCSGFFLRFFTLQYNEFATKSSWFIAFAFPYVSLQFWNLKNNKLKILQGFLAGFIIALKPNYGILIITFEIIKLLEIYKSDQSKKIKLFFAKVFSLSNLVTAFILTIYYCVVFIFVRDFFLHIPNFSALYFDPYYISTADFGVFRENLLPILFFIAILSREVERNSLNKVLLIASLSSFAIFVSEMLGGYDQRFYIFSFFTPVIFLTFKELKINAKNLTLFLLAIFIFSSDQYGIYFLFLNLCFFWWLLILIYKKYSPSLILAAIFSLFIIVINPSSEWERTPFIIIAIYILKDQIFFKKYDNNGSISKIYLIILAIFVSYFLKMFVASVFNLENQYAFDQKSPNLRNEKVIKSILFNTKKDDQVVIISDIIHDMQPALIHSKKVNQTPFHQFCPLYQEINDYRARDPLFYSENKYRTETLQYMFFSLKKQIFKKDNKMVIVKRSEIFRDKCGISFLEYYFSLDPEFARNFLQNYSYLDSGWRSIEFEAKTDPKITKLSDMKVEKRKKIFDEFEIYLRK